LPLLLMMLVLRQMVLLVLLQLLEALLLLMRQVLQTVLLSSVHLQLQLLAAHPAVPAALPHMMLHLHHKQHVGLCTCADSIMRVLDGCTPTVSQHS
jgi:hypothetical protein